MVTEINSFELFRKYDSFSTAQDLLQPTTHGPKDLT